MNKLRIGIFLTVVSLVSLLVIFTKSLAETLSNKEKFVFEIFDCVEELYSDYKSYPLDRQVPFDLIVAMAAYESAWGTSRFAVEGNNYFGIRTWDLENIPHLKAKKRPNAPWGVRKYSDMCDCIKDYIQILNNHPAYEEFRYARIWELRMYGYTNATTLARFLVAWSELGEKYTNQLRKIIVEIHKDGYYQKLPVDIKGQIIYEKK